MPIIQLHVFSGRSDPIWTITDAQYNELADRVDLRTSSQLPSRLGYRGFTIRPDRSEPVSESEDVSIFQNPDAERDLLLTGREALDENIIEYINESLDNPEPSATRLDAPSCPPCVATTAPTYTPRRWNVTPIPQHHNNCYNYANDRITNTFAQPGRGSGTTLSSLSCPDVGSAATRDGLSAVPNYTTTTLGWYVALVIWPDQDYHWYRQDDVGCWSHKPGATRVIDVDNARVPISDPRSANRGPYTVFCSFMTTSRAVRID